MPLPRKSVPPLSEALAKGLAGLPRKYLDMMECERREENERRREENDRREREDAMRREEQQMQMMKVLASCSKRRSSVFCVRTSSYC